MTWNGRWWLLRASITLSLGGMGGALVAGGCGSAEPPCGEAWNPCLITNEDGTSNGVCAGKCVIQPMDSFYNPMLLWIGDPDDPEPACEDLTGFDLQSRDTEEIAPRRSFRFRSLLPGDEPCPTCSCSVPSCSMPEIVAAHSHASCENTPAATLRPFNPPRVWNGECTSPGTVPADEFSAIWIAPGPDGWCTPSTVGEPSPPKSPAKIAVACSGLVMTTWCPEIGEVCMVNQQETNVPPGWRYCMIARYDGISECYPPAGSGERPRFSDKLTFYDRNLERSCEPCVCLPSIEPRECVARVSAYSDRACSEDALLGTTTVTAGEVDRCLRPEEEGAALGSIRAELEINQVGFCEPVGGEPRPTTVCCLPEPDG
ncbi:hypothetical protein WMF37_34390 [Sorangium sp. So ce291]|uniref:hypothetical protein n=1 Tax=Sorangium sp. So ce291 TaxID=3133294 RepID=UPI003F5F873D